VLPSVVTYLSYPRSMNAECPENYISFMFANARKYLEKMRYSDSYHERQVPDEGSSYERAGGPIAVAITGLCISWAGNFPAG
jgi:hypothetical protein